MWEDLGLPDQRLWLKIWERSSLLSIRVSQVVLAAPEDGSQE